MAYFKCKGKPTYRWHKYNALPRYAQSVRTVNGQGNVGYVEWTDILDYTWGKATGYTFDETTGLFTLTGGYRISLPTSGGVQVADSSAYALFCGGKSNDSAMSNVTSIVYDGNTGYGGIQTLKMRKNDIQFYGGNWNIRTSYISHYIQGETSYGIVKSQDINAHPVNGRDTDGYWYVKI